MFGEFIKYKRTSKGLTIKEFANNIGYLNIKTYRELERSDYGWDMGKLRLVTKEFGLKLSGLFLEYENWLEKGLQ